LKISTWNQTWNLWFGFLPLPPVEQFDHQSAAIGSMKMGLKTAKKIIHPRH